MELVVTFLSGVTPNDLLRCSLPYMYMNVDVESTDGETHSVQLYSDISAEWVSGDHGANAQWDYGTINGTSGPSAAVVASSAASASATSTVYGTQTAFNVPEAVAHTNVPIHANGQGLKPNATHQVQPTYSPVQILAAAATSGVAYHKVYRQQQLEFSETNQQADWGYW